MLEKYLTKTKKSDTIFILGVNLKVNKANLTLQTRPLQKIMLGTTFSM